MAKGNLGEAIAKARDAVEGLSTAYTNPRLVEADLSILAVALAELGQQLKAISKSKKSPNLYAVIRDFAAAKLLPGKILSTCREIEDLVNVADYDISDPDEFGDEVGKRISLLRDELEKLFTSLDKTAAAPN